LFGEQSEGIETGQKLHTDRFESPACRYCFSNNESPELLENQICNSHRKNLIPDKKLFQSFETLG